MALEDYYEGEYPKPSISVSWIENPGISGGVSGVSVPSRCGFSFPCGCGFSVPSEGGDIEDAPPIGLFANLSLHDVHVFEEPYITSGLTCTYVTLADGELVQMLPLPDDSFFSSHPVYSLIEEVQEDGNHFVYIPRFYCAEFSLSDYGSGQLISHKPLPGFSLHRAFYDSDGNEVKGILVSKYLATDEGGVAVSKPGDFPVLLGADWVDVTNSMLDGYIDYRVLNYADWNALRMLVCIEYGDYSLGSYLQNGATNPNPSYPDCVPVDDPIFAEVSWRGIIGLWGNVFLFLPGIVYSKISCGFDISCNGLSDFVYADIEDNYEGQWRMFSFLQGLYFPTDIYQDWELALIKDYVRIEGSDNYRRFYAGANIDSCIMFPGMFSGVLSASPPFLTGFRLVKVVR